jgi:hypothetical protein
MSNDTGRGSWPQDRPTGASVRHLHADQTEGSSATATEEWYETERLAGQITAGARSAPPAFSRGEAPGVLDWRHAEVAPAPTAFQRLGRSLADRLHRAASLFVATGHRSHQLNGADARAPDAPVHKQAQRRRLTALTTWRAVAPPTVEPQEDGPTAGEILAAEPSSPRTDPCGPAQLAPQRLDWRSAATPKARRARPSRRGLIGTALALTAAAIAVIAITSHTNGRAVTRDQASFARAVSGVGVIAAAKTVLGVLGSVEHQARTTPARQRINSRRAHPRRRLQHNTSHRHSRPARLHTSSPAPQAPADSQASSSAGGGGALSTAGSASQASAAPASSSQSTSSAPATTTESYPAGSTASTGSSQPTSSAPPTTRRSQPAGPTGSAALLGPGHCSC